MSNVVGTKVHKKQSKELLDPRLEQAMLALEGVCVRVLDDRLSVDDADGLYAQQALKNIVTPVSLALAEAKGPRHFQYHYRHKADDASVLQPVIEDASAMLARVCEQTLAQCAKKLVGVHDHELVKRQQALEAALRGFLFHYAAR